jgi:mercuric ion transport protein
MTNQGLLRTGIIDTVIAPICCFSPILIIRLGAVGLSAMVGWLGYVLFFPLVVFAGITI